MGFLFVDSFDHYTSLAEKWDGVNLSPTISAGNGRFGTNGLSCSVNPTYVYKSVPSATTYYIGCGFYYPPTLAVNGGIIAFKSGTTWQTCLGLEGASHCLQVLCGDPSGGTVLWTSADAISGNVWHYLEFMTTIGDSGAYAVILDGVELVNTTGDTKPSTAADITTICIGNMVNIGTSVVRYYDDVYIHDTAFQGDVRIIYRAPDGAGSHSDWTPSAGANYECVDDAAPDPAGDYVSSDTAGHIDTYEMTDLTQSAGTVLAVVGNYYCQKTDAGVREVAMLTELPSSPTQHLESSPKAVPSSWAYLQFIQETKPGGGAWTVTDSKDAQMGIKLET